MRWTWVIVASLALATPALAFVGQGASGPGVIDTVRPTVSSLTAQSTQTVSVSFSKSMRSPGVTTPANYALSGAGIGNLGATPSSVGGTGPYIVTWNAGEMLDGGSVTLTASGLQDTLGNLLGTPSSGVGTGIGTIPTGSLSIDVTPTPGYTNAQSVNLTLSASDAVGVSKMRFSNDGATWVPADWASAPAYATSYAGWMLTAGDGVKTVYAQFRDAAGNVSTATISDQIALDTTHPSVLSIALVGSPSSSAATVDFLVTFSEPVETVSTSDFATSTSGTVTTPPAVANVTGTGDTRIVTVSVGLMEGSLGLDVADADHSILDVAANDLSGGGSSGLVHNADTVAPRVVSIAPVNPGDWSSPSGPTNHTTIDFTIVFNEAIGQFPDGAITLAGGGPAAFSFSPMDSGDHKTWTATVIQLTGDGDLTLAVNSGSGVTDLAGNALAEGMTSSPAVRMDNTRPTPVISGATTLTNAVRTITIDFGEAMSGFSADALAVNNGTASNLQSTGTPGVYTVDILGSGANTVFVSLEADKAKDLAGNFNNATTETFWFPFDGIAPTATIALADPTPTESNALHFNVNFSENVGTSFTADAVTEIGLAAQSITVSGAESSYVVTVTPSDPDADGTAQISIGSRVADLAGNPYAGGLSPIYTIANWRGFATEPVGDQMYAGGSHTFEAAVVRGPVQYRWKMDDGHGHVTAGPAEASWQRDNLAAADSGEYWCEATYLGTPYSTRRATLLVVDHLRIDVPPGDAFAKLGSSHVFAVTTIGGFEPLFYLWKKDGTEIPGATESRYTRSTLDISDSGAYTVEITDSGTDATSASAYLDVLMNVPAAGLAGLAAVAALTALAGARRLRGK